MGVIGGYVFPHVCSRCASQKAARQWRLLTPDIPGLKLVNQNERWVRTYALDVPVCEACHETLQRASLARVAAVVLSALLGLGISSWVLQLLVGATVNGLLFFIWVFAGLLIGLAVGIFLAVPAIDYYLKGQVGRIFNAGHSVRFYNRTYQQLFNRMNQSPARQGTVHRVGVRS